MGAAIGRSAFFVTTLVFGIYKASKVMQIKFDMEAFWKTGISSILMALTIIAIQAWKNSVFLIPLYIGIGLLIYGSSLKILKAIKIDDIKIMREIIPKKFHPIITSLESFFFQN